MKFMNMNRFGPRPYREEESGGDVPPGGGRGGPANFIETLPEDLRGNEALKNFQDPGQLAKSYLELKSYQGNSLRIPGEDAGEEDRKAFIDKLTEKVPNLMLKPDFAEGNEQAEEFFRTLGKPAEAKDYTVPEVEGFEVPEDRVEALRTIGHKMNLTKDQFTGIMAAVMEMDKADSEAVEAQIQQDVQALKQEWGAAFDERKNLVLAVAKHTGAPDRLIDSIANDAAGPDTMKWLLKVSNQFKGEGIQVAGQENQGNGSGAMTPTEAQARISEINNNPQHPYWVASHPDHKKAMDEMVKLQGFANPS